MSRRVGLLYGFFGSNHGDRAVTRGALSQLQEWACGEEIVVVSGQLSQLTRAGWSGMHKAFPKTSLVQFSQALSMFKSQRSPRVEIVEAILNSDALLDSYLEASGLVSCSLVVFGGGEQLFSYGDDSDWVLAGRVLPLLAAAKRGKKLVALPTTFGPFKTEFSERLMRAVFEAMSTLATREPASAELLAQQFGLAPPVHLDPAYFVPTRSKARRAGSAAALRVALVPRMGDFGMRLATAPESQWARQQSEVGGGSIGAAELYADIAKKLTAGGTDVTVFVQAHADDKLVRAISRAVGEKKAPGRLTTQRSHSLEQFIRDLSFHEVVVTSRFHSAIFASMIGCLPIGIYFDAHGHKTPGLFSLLSADDLVFNAKDASADAILETIDANTTRMPDRRFEICARVDRLRKATVEYYRAAFAP